MARASCIVVVWCGLRMYMLCASQLCATLGWIVSTSSRHIFNGGVRVLVLSEFFVKSSY